MDRVQAAALPDVGIGQAEAARLLSSMPAGKVAELMALVGAQQQQQRGDGGAAAPAPALGGASVHAAATVASD